MLTKYFLALNIIFASFYVSINAQSTNNESLIDWEAGAKSLVLLQNHHNLIPLQALDTLRMAFVPFGLPLTSDLEHTLQQYATLERLVVPTGGSLEDAINWAAQQTKRYHLFILGIADQSDSPLPAYLIHHFYLNALLEQGKSVAIVLGGEHALFHVPHLAKAEALLVQPIQNRWSASLAAQVVFGGASASGRLPKDLSTDFKIGMGLDTPSPVRLGYAPPAVVGFDSEKLQVAIRAIVQSGLEAQAYPGAQVLVAKDGKVVYHETFGHHTYEQETPVKPDDIYDFASITKIAAALPAVMRLYGNGTLDIDQTLGDYYPLFRRSNKVDLSFRSMLTHTSGLMAWIPFWRGTLKGNAQYPWQKGWDATSNNTGNYKWRTFDTDSSAQYNLKVTDSMWLHRRYHQEILRAIKKSPLKPEQGYVYSDLHFYLYPAIVSRLTGQDFETYLKTHFYQPLGANTLTFNPLRFYTKSRIVPTERDTFFRRTLLHGRVHDEGAAMLGGVSGHAGLFGTTGDLAKLMQLYLNGGTYGGQRYLQAEVLAEFTSCTYCHKGVHRGIGFDKPLLTYDARRSSVAQSASPESFGHSGYTGTFTWADPAHNLLYIFFCNRVHPTRDNRKLLDMNIRPRVHQAIYDALQ
ncbi:MAG TPA: serine hydrolase [Saprospiraceae bacterium]|nr:serine hydrolase [Saprospiraceae bacterium]